MLGILGGTFDPIHQGHLIMAELAREALGLERILFTPAGDPPHKQQNSKSPAHHRRRLVELAIAGNPGFQLCTVDLERPGPHYSTETVRLIREQYGLPAEACFFIIGGDSLQDLPTWHRPELLVTLCRLALIHRPGYRPDLAELERQLPGLSQQVVWVETPLLEISASVIRRRAAQGQSIRYQVPEPVRAYIEAEQLYKSWVADEP
jgi:nicotinate-nucleotide adenylyltransferase